MLLIEKKFLKMKIQIKYSILLKKSATLIKEKKRRGIKILTPKQMLQRLPIVYGQVKASNISENLPNEIRQIITTSYQAKEITKKSIESYNAFNSYKTEWMLYL